MDRNLTLEENVFRIYSEGYFHLVNEVRELYNQDLIELNDNDVDIIESDLGSKAIYEGIEVYLDAPIEMANNQYYFLLDTESLIPNTYYLDVLVTSNQEVTTLKGALQFDIISQVELRKGQ